MSKKRIVVVCPGRGSYTKESLKSLIDKPLVQEKLRRLDELRIKDGYPSLTELDQAENFKVSLHTLGEHASTLIYACALSDFLEINQDHFEIVAMTGNSMGWYLALSMSQAIDLDDSYSLIQTMGSQMKDNIIGAQIIYPIVDDHWLIDPLIEKSIEELIFNLNQKNTDAIYISIRLGGYLVLAGEQKALNEFMKQLPKKENYPFQLVNHAAFHTPLLEQVSLKAQNLLKDLKVGQPQIPLIDGRGVIFQPYSTDPRKIFDYTLGAQVTETYDFSKALEVSLKEFSPDHIVLLGPGNSLGGAIAQILIDQNWMDIKNKNDFMTLQKKNPFLLSMGLKEQKQFLL